MSSRVNGKAVESEVPKAKAAIENKYRIFPKYIFFLNYYNNAITKYLYNLLLMSFHDTFFMTLVNCMSTEIMTFLTASMSYCIRNKNNT